MLGSIGAQLVAIHRDMAEADQACLLAECQHLNEQLAQRRQVTAAELVDGAEARPVQGRDDVIGLGDDGDLVDPRAWGVVGVWRWRMASRRARLGGAP